MSKLAVLVLLGSSLLPAQSNRPFYMSSTGTQAVPNGSPVYQNFPAGFTPQMFGQDTDLTSVFPEFLGIPFDLFAVSAMPAADHPWTLQMKNLATAVKAAGKPVMLQTVLTRDAVVAKATNNNGSLRVDPGWAPYCIDFTSPQYANMSATYANYASWMAATFKPKYFVIMVEINLYYVLCGGNTASWRQLVNIERNAYNIVKFQNPFMIVFPSFKLEDLYGQTLNGYDQTQYQAMANIKRDRLGFATYAYGIQLAPGVFANPYQLPVDYLRRIRDRNPSEPKIMITETGWNGDSIAVNAGGCVNNYIYSSPSFASAYMNFLLQSAYVGGFEAITWWSDRDLIQASVMNSCYPNGTAPLFPECGGEVWCTAINQTRSAPPAGTTAAFTELVFKAFGSMGIRTYDGSAKPEIFDSWKRFLLLPRQ